MSNYLAPNPAPPEQIKAWVEQFHRDGYLFLPSVLPPDLCRQLRDDLDLAMANKSSFDHIDLVPRMFEHSNANVSLFGMEPIVSFAEALIAPDCHVLHNNSFRTRRGQGIDIWHQDDPPHYLVTSGEPPKNVRLPVLWFTANYYLTDVPTPAHGPTELIPRSHLFGSPCPAKMEGTSWEKGIHSCCGPMGSVVMFNNQVWHRGALNQTDQSRYITQITYGRRMIGHKYFPFMNYQMPEHVYANADPRLRRLLGFLPSGAYG